MKRPGSEGSDGLVQDAIPILPHRNNNSTRAQGERRSRSFPRPPIEVPFEKYVLPANGLEVILSPDPPGPGPAPHAESPR